MKTSAIIKTKDVIQQVVVQLFNELGVRSITSSHIAAEMGISYGNVDYHYKNKEEVLLAIYGQIRNEM